MKTWEYRVENGLGVGSEHDMQTELGQLGKDGWELAAVLPLGTNLNNILYIFKRQHDAA